MTSTASKLPTLYLPHGGGPCFFMEWTMGPRDTWKKMAHWLETMPRAMSTPRALVVVSAHWEAVVPTVTTSASPPLIYDYSGFPPHTYALEWPAHGSPEVAERVVTLLAEAGIESARDEARGFDHGVFVPLKVAFPDARVPTVQLSLVRGLDPEAHLAIGRALAPLRDEGVLVLGSGMSFHSMRTFLTPAAARDSKAFDAWLTNAVESEPAVRDAALRDWTRAPAARACHPREEHLLPLMVAAGAARADRGHVVFRDEVLGATVSAVRFG